MSHENGIPVPSIQEWMRPETINIRRNAGRHLLELIDTVAGFRSVDISSISLLPVGIFSTAYILLNGDSRQVIKFSPWRSPSEGDVMQKWYESGLSVPKIGVHGVVPSTIGTDLPVSYTSMEAITEESGRTAVTARKLVNGNPLLAPVIGTLMGKELAQMHSISAASSRVGSESVMSEFNNTSARWDHFIRDEIEKYSQGLSDINLTRRDIEKLPANISPLAADHGLTYLHNDASLDNILVPSMEPAKIIIIDPNPVIGDKHWDLAYLAERAEAAIRKSEANPDYSLAADIQKGYFSSVKAAYEAAGQEINTDSLLVCQLARLLKRYAWSTTKASQQLGPAKGKLEIEVTQQMIRERAEKLLSVS